MEPNFTQRGEIGSEEDNWTGSGPRQMADGRWWSPESGWIVDDDQVNREFEQNAARQERHAAPERVYNPHEDAARFGKMSDPRFTSGPQMDMARPDESRGMSMDALGMLRRRAEGGVTPAQQMQEQQTAGAVAGTQSGAASIKGGAMARAAASRGAQATGARINAQGRQDGAALRAREMADASNQYFGAAQGQRGRDLGVATTQADLDAKQRAANEQRDQFYQGLEFDQKKTTVDDALGRTAAQSAAENSARTASLNESAATANRAKDVANGVLGGLQGGISTFGNTQNDGGAKKSSDPWDPKNYSGTGSDPKTKQNVVPLYEDAGSGVERHWDADKSKAKPDAISGASLSGPAPKYSTAKTSDAPARKRAEVGQKARKPTAAELKKQADAMLSGINTQKDAQLANGASAGGTRAKAAEYDGKYFGSPFPESKKETPAKAAPNFKDVLEERFGEGGESRGDPYRTPPPPNGVTGAPKGYAASRNGGMGSMFGSTMRPEYSLGSGYSDDPSKSYESRPQIRPENQWAPGSADLYAGSHARDIATSDPKTKNADEHFGGPMADANRSMEPSSYEYKDEFLPPEQQRGETNVGPMADKMEADPVAGTAIVKDPNTGMLAIDKTKGLKLVMGGLASLQRQVDQMGGRA